MRITHVVEVEGSQVILLDSYESVKVGSRLSRRADVWDVTETDHIQVVAQGYRGQARIPIFRVRSLTGGPQLEENDEVTLLDQLKRPIVYNTNEAQTPLLIEPKVGQKVLLIREDGSEFFQVGKNRQGFFVQSYAKGDPEVFRIAFSGVNWYVSSGSTSG